MGAMYWRVAAAAECHDGAIYRESGGCGGVQMRHWVNARVVAAEESNAALCAARVAAAVGRNGTG